MKQHEVFPNSKSHNSLSRISCRTRFSLLGVIRYSLSWTACNSNKAAWQPQNYHIPTPCTMLTLVNFSYYVKFQQNFKNLTSVKFYFVCRWGSQIELRRAPDKEIMPISFCRHCHLPSIQLRSAYFGQERSAHSPANNNTPHQEHFELLDVSNCPNYSFSNT